MIGIYKIKNKINGKVYIGLSTNIEKRWNKHKNEPFNLSSAQYNCLLYKAIRKYGLDNFEFSIIEECSKEMLPKREKYWIKYYNSFIGFDNCNGYNMTIGGETGAPKNLSYSDILKIQDLLINTRVSQMEIANRFNVSQVAISDINIGDAWRDDNYDYPLRVKKFDKIELKKYYCIECGAEISKGSQKCKRCCQKVKNRPSPEQLYKDLMKTNFVQVGKKYGVTDNAIRKWCKGYGMSTKAKDYK